MPREKKSESLEVRLSHSQKRDFMEICNDRGTTASDVVRSFISGFIEDAVRTETVDKAPSRLKELSMTLRKNPRKTLTASVGALGAFALLATTPSLADDDVFARLDKNNDGIVTADEISPEGSEGYSSAKAMVGALDLDEDGALSASEFHGPKGCVVRREDSIEKSDEGNTRTLTMKMAAYDFSDPEKNKISIMTTDMTLSGDLDEDEVQENADSAMADMRQRLDKETGDPNLCDPGTDGKKIKKRIERSVEQ